MSRISKGKANSIGVLVTLLFLLTLAFLPGLLRKKKFSFPVATSDNSQITFTMDRKFPLIEGSSHREVTLRELAGESKNGLLVNFWATWCPPCLDELPSLEFFYRQISSRDDLPRLITISVDVRQSDVEKLYKTLDFSPTFPVLHDPEGAFSSTIGTTRFPETYWINPEGKVIHKWIGPQHWLSDRVIQTIQSLNAS